MHSISTPLKLIYSDQQFDSHIFKCNYSSIALLDAASCSIKSLTLPHACQTYITWWKINLWWHHYVPITISKYNIYQTTKLRQAKTWWVSCKDFPWTKEGVFFSPLTSCCDFKLNIKGRNCCLNLTNVDLVEAIYLRTLIQLSH